MKPLPILAFAALALPALADPLKVYILAGQSNMQGHAHVRTMDVIGLDPKTAPMLKEMRDANGDPKVCDDVWISSIGSSDEEKTGKLTVGFGPEKGGPKIGPEFTFGIYMQKQVDEPILIIKTAWGGKSIHTDFRPPSAGPFEFRDDQLAKFKEQGKDIDKIKAERKEATGHYYRLMTEHVKKVLGDIKRVYPDYDAEEGYEIAGFVWFQGWNDMVAGDVYPDRGKPGGYDAYSENLAHFIRDVRKDFSAPEMPFVIGVMGAGGPVEEYGPSQQRYAGIHSEFRKAMAAPASMPEFKGNVTAVYTEKYWDQELTKLREKDRELQKQVDEAVKAGKIEGKNKKDEIEKLRAKEFDDREREILTNGASNAEFHYLGSAKILGQIGKAFAEAIGEMSK
ncbi:sialate O-acetylesterase [Haloferula helveola]|uniref:Sialate O-acetylesterase n=1 Tax=Haloferula helveola TaxID=490095 RepID=A0ABN6H4L1_9BACT|nr:sialate O-acetylesterase [Haloferula helveola]